VRTSVTGSGSPADGKATVEFMQHLSERDIAVIQGAAKEAKADLETLRKWAVSS